MSTKERPLVRLSEGIEVKDFDFEEVIDSFKVVGAVSVPYLSESTRRMLLAEAQKLNTYVNGLNVFITQRGRTVEGEWFEIDMLESAYLPSNSRLSACFRDLNQDMIKKSNSVIPYPFNKPLNLDTFGILYYPPGSLGLPKHTDPGYYLRIILPLDEGPRLFVCDNVQGDNSLEIDRSPGNLILMRAPGVRGITEAQHHYVTDAQSGGYVLSASQKAAW